LAYRYSDGKKFEEFLELVSIAFKVAEMNPLKPHKHSRRATVESMTPGLSQKLDQALGSGAAH
jgi:hypothetical protein